jgi:hypothetical protein
MARFATVDANNVIQAFTTGQMTYNPSKGDAARPAPWRSLPAPEVAQPAYDPATQALNHSFRVNANDVTEEWTVRPLTSQELSDLKDSELSAVETVAATALFNHENRIRALESKAPITKAQFIAGLKALL